MRYLWLVLGMVACTSTGNLDTDETDVACDRTRPALQHQALDVGANGSVEANYDLRFGYDDAGRVVRREHDNDLDGAADTIYLLTYDSEGRILSEGQDLRGDGTVDGSSVYTWREDDTMRKSDANNDGTFSEWRFTRNSARQIIQADVDVFINDQKIDEELYEYGYDDAGRKVTEHYENGGGDIDRSWTYDADGNVASMDEDDGVVYRTTYSYEFDCD